MLCGDCTETTRRRGEGALLLIFCVSWTTDQSLRRRPYGNGSRIWVSRRSSSHRKARGENGYVESLIGKMSDELFNREIFYTLAEARVLVEQWRRDYNQVRPHSSLGYRPPAPESIEWPLGATRQPPPVMLGFPPQWAAQTLGAGQSLMISNGARRCSASSKDDPPG
jgi:hypothetical protein